MNVSQKGRVRLYACGGGGLNIAQRLEKHRDQNELAFATLSTAYVDTSRANIRSSMQAEHLHIIDGLDGQGGVRGENRGEIGNNVPAILQKFEPLDFNIVLHTAAGGSGSVIGPLLVSELLLQDKPVVVIAVGSAESQLYADNSLKTLKTYESIANKRNAPVVIYYAQNSVETRREQVDMMASEAIIALCLLFSREHRELDSRDLRNWLRFNEKITKFPPQVACLSLVEKENDFSKLDIGNLISVATLAHEGSDTMVTPVPPYQKVGFIPEGTSERVHNRVPMHFIVSDGFIAGVAKRFNQLLSELNAANEAAMRQRTNHLLDAKDVAGEDGLVL